MIPLIHKILFLTDADQQSDKVHNFLTLYSVYQKLVLADSKINAELLNYDYLRYTENDAIEIHDKFTKGRARLQKVMHQQNTPEDCILVGGHNSCNNLQTIFVNIFLLIFLDVGIDALRYFGTITKTGSRL